jgi:hypothetical protein
MKMEQVECSETSAFNNQMPGKYPKDHTQDGVKVLVTGYLILLEDV